VVTSLSYAYAAKNTGTVDGRVVSNFPLTITGTDIATDLPFEYQYDTSQQSVTVKAEAVPEPSTLALAGVVFVSLVGASLWKRTRGVLR
jgi:hypothetical protein